MTVARNWRRSALALGAALGALGMNAAIAAPVNLSSWIQQGPGAWDVAPDNNSVVQGANLPQPSMFFSGLNDKGKTLSGTIEVESTVDDDFIGFVLGFNSGDLSNAAADYILIDWKQNSQNLFGCTGQAGLAISRVTGPLAAGGSWCHTPANNVTELARATNLGSTGWADNQEYAFDLTFTDNLIEVYVDGVLELSVAGIFGDGSFGFYNFSQANVRYAGLVEGEVPPPEVPLPAALPLMMFGLGGLAFATRRQPRNA